MHACLRRGFHRAAVPLIYMVCAVAPQASAQDDPFYTHWATFKPGARVVYHVSYSDPEFGDSSHTETATLKEVQNDYVVIAFTSNGSSAGPQAWTDQCSRNLFPRTRLEIIGSENLLIKGRDYSTRHYRLTLLDPQGSVSTVTDYWFTPEIPGYAKKTWLNQVAWAVEWEKGTAAANPLYAQWASFSPGARVTYRRESAQDSGGASTTFTETLKEVSEEYVLVERFEPSRGTRTNVKYNRQSALQSPVITDLGSWVIYLKGGAPYASHHIREAGILLNGSSRTTDYYFLPAVPGAARIDYGDGTAVVAVDWQK